MTAGPATPPVATAEVDTPHGPARVTVARAGGDGPATAVLVLGHGAGGGITAVDLVAATQAAHGVGADVVLVEQPYRVAGRRTPPPAPKLDEAWHAVLAHVREHVAPGERAVPLVVGGRSSGARVACRTAAAAGAAAALCLAFPLHLPGRPDKTRQPELDGAGVPVLVVQGGRDPYGVPEPAAGREVVVLRGDHGLKSDVPGVRDAVGAWLARLLRSDRPGG